MNGLFERNLTELSNQFIEGSQAFFTLMRNLQSTWQETLSDMATKFGTNLTVGLATGVLHDDDLNISEALMTVVLQDLITKTIHVFTKNSYFRW